MTTMLLRRLADARTLGKLSGLMALFYAGAEDAPAEASAAEGVPPRS